MFILDDVDSDRLALPKQYGIDDVPPIVEDKAFNGDGSFKGRRPLLRFLCLRPAHEDIVPFD